MNTCTARLGLLATLVAGGALLGGCASMDRNECLAVDWRTVGYEDGTAGMPGEHIAQHRKACARYGVATDLDAYQAGRQMGLREYCQAERGYQVGEGGGVYHGVCPAELEPGFLEGYNPGHELYVRRARVAQASSALLARHNELERIDNQLVAASALIISADASSEQRAQALVDVKHLTERQTQLRGEIRQLERDRAQYQQELEQYTSSVAARN